MTDDPVDRIAPPVRHGDRLTVRHRTGDRATDVIGWLAALDARVITLETADGRSVAVDRNDVVLARRVPPAAGGPDPRTVTAERLQRIAAAGWADAVTPLGAWLLRDAGGFTRRANSVLAVGDPGTGTAAAAAAVIDFYRSRGLTPLAQVITGDPAEDALRGLGWTEGGPDTDLMTARLADLLTDAGGLRPTDPTITLDPRPRAGWLAARAAERGLTGPLPPAALRVVAGDDGTVFATRSDPDTGGLVAIARGHLGGDPGARKRTGASGPDPGPRRPAGDWLGVSAVWTDPGQRRRGHATALLLTLAGWAARHGARYAYLQVEADNTPALLGYRRLGFARHHGYRYLTPAAPRAQER